MQVCMCDLRVVEWGVHIELQRLFVWVAAIQNQIRQF